MPPTDIVSPGFLIELAAEGIGPIVAGCAGAVLAGPLGAVGGAVLGKVVAKGINYFGPRIVEAWWQKLRGQPVAEQQVAVEKLAALSPSEAQREAAAAVDRVAPDASPEDKKTAAAYLAAIPAAVKRSLAPDRSGRMTVPGSVFTANAQSLTQLLPTDLPPFHVPCDLSGTPYRLEALLGTGGFGAVYRATAPSLQFLPFALKFCLDPEMKATLLQERNLLTRLRDAGSGAWSERIVRLFGFDLEYPRPYLVYEFVPGGDLTGHIAARRQQTGKGLSPNEALALVTQIAEGLAFAHGQGLVHRDLKPANVLMHGDRVKLADFGIGGVVAGRAANVSKIGTSSYQQLAADEQADLFRGSGTLLYMCREQQRGDAPDPRHDVYSLGVLWYQLLTGDVTQGLHPAWDRELEVKYQTPKSHVEAIRRCVGLIEERPADGAALLKMLKPKAKAEVVAEVLPAEQRVKVRLVEEPKRSGARSGGRRGFGSRLRQAAEAPLGFPVWVRIPGIIMAVVSFLFFCFNVIGTIVFISMVFQDPRPEPDTSTGGLIFYLIGLVCSLVAVIAGIQMARGRTWWLALLGCVAMPFGTILIGAPVAVWALIVLLLPEGRKAFERT